MMQIIRRYGLLLSLLCGLLSVQRVAAGANEWTNEGSGIDASVNALAFHPGRSDTLFAGAVNGFYRSEDGGVNWQPSGAQLVDRSVLCIGVDPAQSTQLYAGVNNGLYVSRDGGRTWQSTPISVGVLSVSAGYDGRVYAGTFGQGIYLSEDAGRTWRSAEGFTQSDIVFSLAVHPFESETVYAGTGQGLYVSRDAGSTWSAIPELAGLSIRSIALSAESTWSGLAAVGTYGKGVYISRDNGSTWQAANAGLSDLSVRWVALDPEDENGFYAATTTGGFFRSKDGALSWSSMNTGLADASARWIGIGPGTDRRVYGLTRSAGILTMSFSPEARIELSTERLDFGSVGVGANQSLALDISNDGQAPLVISNINIDRESPFSISAVSVTIPAGQSERLQVRFGPLVSGAASTQLVIRSNDADRPSAQVALLGMGVQAELAIQPSALNFGSVRIGSYADTTVLLSNEGNATLDLRNAFFEDSSFRVLSQLPTMLSPGQRTLVRLRFVPLVARGISSNLIVAAGQGLERQVPVDGVGTAADISLSSATVDFGTVDLMGSRKETIEISNSGNAELTVHNLYVTGSSFALDTEAPLVIPPGGIRSVELRFFPIEAGVHSGRLTVESDALGRSARVDVDLLGAGGALSLRAVDPVAAGLGAADLLVADLNGDGMPDLALADSAGGQVRVHLNNGVGSYAEAVAYPTFNGTYQPWDQPMALAVAPIYGGTPDLLVADPVSRSISVLSNDGSGGFDGARSDLYIGHMLADVVAADFDADGDADIATANWDDGSITVLSNGGRGTFSSRVTIDVPAGPQALAASDLNADDLSDLVVVSSIDGTVSVLLGNLQGGFAARRDYAVGLEPVTVQVLDFDADGDNDVLVGNRASRDVAVLINDGEGELSLSQRVNVNLPIADMYFSDLTRDIFSDLVVASPTGDYIAFLENEAGSGFVVRDIIASQVPLRRVAIVDVNGDGANDIAALSATEGQLQIFLNEDARLGDPPHPPSAVAARDLGRDLGRQIEVVWKAPELDEQLGRTTRYSIFRSESREGPYSAIDTLSAGSRSFVDPAATLADTFYYYVVSGNASVESAASDTVWAVSQPSPFFELEVLNEPRFSIGDTLVVRAYIVPTAHVLTGVSLYMSYDAASLSLIDVLTDSTVSEESESIASVQPFRVSTRFESRSIENELHAGAVGKVNLSLVESMGNPLIEAGVEPVLLGELRFVTSVDTIALISIDDEPLLNRSSAVVDENGQWIPPFIPDRPVEVAIRDFPVRGRIGLQGRQNNNANVQASLFFYDEENRLLVSPINDEDRLSDGIQHTLDENGGFALAQIPPGSYRLLVKPYTHLKGHVMGGAVEVGGELGDSLLTFEWVVRDTSQLLPVGDANEDNRINLADFGLLVDHFNSSVSADRMARRADFNGDGFVGLDDFMLLAENFGRIGMELTDEPAVKAVPQGTLARVDAEGLLRLQTPRDLTALSLLLLDCDPALLSLAESVWDARQVQMHAWEESGGLRVLVALHDARQPIHEAEYLLQLPQGATVVEGQYLAADGALVDLRFDGIRPLPQSTALLPNYPNPFNPETIIPFAVGAGEGRQVELAIYNSLGQNIRTLFSGSLEQGMHALRWDGRDGRGVGVASGTYFYRLSAGNRTHVRRLLLLR